VVAADQTAAGMRDRRAPHHPDATSRSGVDAG
jgi:hypothetical protein